MKGLPEQGKEGGNEGLAREGKGGGVNERRAREGKDRK